METFTIAAFRSRQAVFKYEGMLKKIGIRTAILSTPRAVSMGCGLSLSFDTAQERRAIAAFAASPVNNLIGFYRVVRQHGRLSVTPVNTTACITDPK